MEKKYEFSQLFKYETSEGSSTELILNDQVGHSFRINVKYLHLEVSYK